MVAIMFFQELIISNLPAIPIYVLKSIFGEDIILLFALWLLANQSTSVGQHHDGGKEVYVDFVKYLKCSSSRHSMSEGFSSQAM